tara:strand:- start:1360 stop:1698 length:339 start_codon:yes stop_codon:yes gene_type:complete
MTQLYLFEKENVMKRKDYVAEIIEKWLNAMDKENIGVQPKCITMLGTMLAEYKITPKESTKDVWQQALNVTGGEFADWYAGLSKNEKAEYNRAREAASAKYDNRHNKELLKG